MKPQNLIRLQVENVQAIKAFVMSPEQGEVNVIAGDNGQGKTSLLVGVGMVFVPPKYWPSDPIRHGEDHGFIEVETEDFHVRLDLKRDKKPKLKISRRIDDDEKMTPQRGERGILNAWVNPLAFDASSFDGDPEVLMKLAGIDFTDLDERHTATYDARKEANSELRTAQTMLEQMPYYDDAPNEEVSVSDLMAEVDMISTHNSNLESAIRRESELFDRVERFKKSIEDYEIDLASLMDTIDHEKEMMGRAQGELVTAKEQIADSNPVMSDAEPRAAIASAGKVNEQVKANRARDDQEFEVGTANATASSRDEIVKGIAKERADRIKNADMPLEGLGFDEQGQVTYEGSLFDQLSSSEQMIVKLSIGAALNPNLKLVTMDRYESLDAETRRAVDAWASVNEITVLTTCVGSCDGAIVIEAGEVKP